MPITRPVAPGSSSARLRFEHRRIVSPNASEYGYDESWKGVETDEVGDEADGRCERPDPHARPVEPERGADHQERAT